MSATYDRPRLLILNWRDPENPKAGGAETLTMEWAQAWRDAGLEVTWFANTFQGSTAESSINGIRVVRRGRPYNQSWHARRLDRQEGPFDLVIEEINTLPFLSCVWARGRSVLLMHQLAREVWFYEASRGIATLGYLLEPFYLRLYRHQPALVLSESTRTDLIGLGFATDRIGLLAGATDVSNHGCKRNKAAEGTFSFIYVGRLTPSKRIHDIIRAFSLARRELYSHAIRAKLRIVGSGSAHYERMLRNLVRSLDIAEYVEFHGWVSNWWLDDNLASSDALVMASVREGWGLVVTEGNAIGIPAIGYRVPGLRDSIQDGVTGLLAKAEKPPSLAAEMVRLASSPDLHKRLSRAAMKDAAFRDWRTSNAIAVQRLALAASQLEGSARQNGWGPTRIVSQTVSTLLQDHMAVARPLAHR